MADDRSDAAAYLGWFFLGAAQQFATEAQGRAGDWFDKSRELFEEQTQRLMSAFEAGKEAMRSAEKDAS